MYDEDEEWFCKKNDREDVSPFLSVFLYCPAILFICECACVCVCVVRTYSRPYGRRQITAWTSPTSLPLQILGLNAEAKKKKGGKTWRIYNKRRRNIFQQCNSVCFVSMYAQIHSVSSFNEDDFTKTVFIIRKDKEYLFTGSTVCVSSDT